MDSRWSSADWWPEWDLCTRPRRHARARERRQIPREGFGTSEEQVFDKGRSLPEEARADVIEFLSGLSRGL